MKLKNKIYVVVVFLFVVVGFFSALRADDRALIIIKDSEQVKKINPSIFGTSILGWEIEHGKKIKSNYWTGADYGYSIWDPKWNEFNKEPLNLIKGIGIKSIRFIGQFTDWEKGVSEFGKKEYQFGLDEQMEFCKLIGAEPIICLQNLYLTESYGKLINYLRKKHPHVQYVEVGNESWFILSPDDYADRYLFYYDMLKKLNPNLKLGIVGKDEDWDAKVIGKIGDKFDFIVKHYYPYGGKNNEIKQDGKKIFGDLLVKTLLEEVNIKDTHNLIAKLIDKDKPIAVTEFNAWFVQEKPVPYRHCLGTALVNAELIKIFMKPENNIMCANYWNFVNEYWGMVANGFNGKYETLNKPYYKRPNYYVFEMYAKHFGDILLDVQVKADGYDASQYRPIRALWTKLKTGTLVKGNLLSAGWQIMPAQAVNAVENKGILEVNFLDCFVAKSAPRNDTSDSSLRSDTLETALRSDTLETAPRNDTLGGTPRNDAQGGALRNDKCTYNYYHSVKKANVEPKTYYKLSGYIKTENLVDKEGVCLEVQDGRGWNATHSALTTEKIKGTADWKYVEAVYEALPDAKSVDVIARRIGESGPLSGKVYFKDVRLEKFIPSIDTKIPYLSVNASKSKDGNKVYLMVINKNMDESITSTIELKDFVPAGDANAWILNGPSVDATNEVNHNNVRITHKKFKIASPPAAARNDTWKTAPRNDTWKTAPRNDTLETAPRNDTLGDACNDTRFEFTFEPHSLTAIEVSAHPPKADPPTAEERKGQEQK